MSYFSSQKASLDGYTFDPLEGDRYSFKAYKLSQVTIKVQGTGYRVRTYRGGKK